MSIRLLARAAEIHDENTAHHVERVNEYSYFLATELGQPRAFCDVLRYSAQLHDVGKMSVNVAVLRKQGPLDDDERDEMMRHPIYGWEILSASDRLGMAAEIALNHHEQWNGGGYPVGRKGEQIPISARIVALADIYDAMTTVRCYQKPMTPRQALGLALHNEIRGRDFYSQVAAESPDQSVRLIAREMAEEESGHVRQLEHWIARMSDAAEVAPDDLDPRWPLPAVLKNCPPRFSSMLTLFLIISTYYSRNLDQS